VDWGRRSGRQSGAVCVVARCPWEETVICAAGPTEARSVTAGPYARIRHPIYLALLGFLLGLALVSANGFFAGLFAFSVVDLAIRIPKEEEQMIEELGEQYRAYMRSTGRLLPRW
jgi:protein-S-isoprenylcysteine O-methyltransferase Ste14